MSKSLQEFYDKLMKRLEAIQATLSSRMRSPALLSLVDLKWLEQAFDVFKSGIPEIYFGTNSTIGQGSKLPIRYAYFKVTNTTKVVAKAKLVAITQENPKDKRLPGSGPEPYQFYYGFRELTWLPPIPLSSLRYFNTGTTVPNDVPGACIIEEIATEGAC